jgi:hypothetical protein
LQGGRDDGALTEVEADMSAQKRGVNGKVAQREERLGRARNLETQADGLHNKVMQRADPHVEEMRQLCERTFSKGQAGCRRIVAEHDAAHERERGTQTEAPERRIQHEGTLLNLGMQMAESRKAEWPMSLRPSAISRGCARVSMRRIETS